MTKPITGDRQRHLPVSSFNLTVRQGESGRGPRGQAAPNHFGQLNQVSVGLDTVNRNLRQICLRLRRLLLILNKQIGGTIYQPSLATNKA